MRYFLFVVICAFFDNIAFGQFLSVSDNGRYLEKADGSPFFYLGDTAWELFHRLSIKEASHYLKNRSDKGFTVIQAVVLAQLGGLSEPNASGDLPFIDGDLSRPNEKYFAHIDSIVVEASSLGLVMGILPTWGSYWSTVNGDQKIFSNSSAQSFGKFLGHRYREMSVIWILGGDENINNDEEREIIEAMAQGLKEGDGGNHLITFHPRGPGRSSDYFHESEWLDFNMFQSSHASRDHDNGLFAEYDYNLTPPKPTLDGEPRYENINVGFYWSGANRQDIFDDYDVRQAAYWSVLAGACGHTYGHNSIWQMYAPGRQPVIRASIPWFVALDHPGAFQMSHLKALFASRPFHKLIPDQSMILSESATPGGKIRGARAEDGSFAIFYSPRGASFTIDKSVVKARKIKEIWFDPRYGISHHVHTGNTQSIQTYSPPTQGRGFDWILILEDADKLMPLPGYSVKN